MPVFWTSLFQLRSTSSPFPFHSLFYTLLSGSSTPRLPNCSCQSHYYLSLGDPEKSWGSEGKIRKLVSSGLVAYLVGQPIICGDECKIKIWVLLFKSRKRDFCGLSLKNVWCLRFGFGFLLLNIVRHEDAHGAMHILVGTTHDLVCRRHTKSHSSCAHIQVSARGGGWQHSLGSGREVGCSDFVQGSKKWRKAGS